MTGHINLKECEINVAGQTRYVLRNVETEPVDYENFVDTMVEESTVTRHDIKGVVSALEEFIARALVDGYSVRLGELGAFRTTVTSTGEDSADNVTADSINSLRVQFTAGSLLKNYLRVDGRAASVRFTVTEKLED